MYQVDMFYTIKTLLDKGKSLRSIARQLGVSRDVVTRVRDELAQGHLTPQGYHRNKLLDEHEPLVAELYKQGLTAELVHRQLVEKHGLAVSYPTVARYLIRYKSREVYVPVLTPPGQEAQVDFGYLGRFRKSDKLVKVWVFSMILSHSRYAYYCLVTDQKVATFIACHIKAFEYFGGVPQTVKIDNLKAGVIIPSFYEPLMQQQYSEFLAYYQSAPLTARVRRPEDKGKVESGVKYVKGNFLKGVDHEDYQRLEQDLLHWNQKVCNRRVHGTTQRVPEEVFVLLERPVLISLPALRYESSVFVERKVNAYGHIAYGQNFYSVPYQYAGESLTLKVSDQLVRVYKDHQVVALHTIHPGKGEFITQESHKPPYKQYKSKEHYQQKARQLGDSVAAFLDALQVHQPHHWRDMLNGVCALRRSYDAATINAACQRALEYHAYSYLAVKNICLKGLAGQQTEQALPEGLGGFGQPLELYDQLTPAYC